MDDCIAFKVIMKVATGEIAGTGYQCCLAIEVSDKKHLGVALLTLGIGPAYGNAMTMEN